ncbi:hypothetical protein IA815_03175 [Listeria welshimeri]|uniref:hypothetical protein n=1 Tax=Listeria welshimeri TaxID=1643 RepID=UPI001887A037|nr:hypothetical protein [Listeria welshimeri]MBF2573944.1 hypothetical protein [Listeria welshimeri]
MISGKQYKGLSDSVYWLDPKHGDYAPEMRKGSKFNYKGETYKILRTENNSKNGMQAMAVAPIDKHGKVDTTEVIIAYAGTNFSDTKDRATDLQTVIQGNKKLDLSPMHPIKESKIDGQAISAQKFADEVKAKYSNSVITTTGHSLGEYLALMIAAENKWRNIGFNGPDPSDVLTNEAKYVSKLNIRKSPNR